MLAPHLTAENIRDWVAAASHQTKAGDRAGVALRRGWH
jgi:hypothetical protein